MSERVGCKHCNFKGYVKSAVLGTNPNEEGGYSVTVCSHCKDSRGYYAYVRNKYGSSKKEEFTEEPEAKILDFNEFKERKLKDKL